jgi:hypothetical protein
MKPLVKVPFVNGTIAGALGIGLLIALYYLGKHPLLIPPYLDFRILLFGIFFFFTLKELRDSWYNGILYFWQGLIACFLFVITYVMITWIGIVLFAGMEPEFLSTYIRTMTDLLKNMPQEDIGKMGKDYIESNLKQLPATNGMMLANLYLWQSMMIGLFVSIILSILLRRQPKT